MKNIFHFLEIIFLDNSSKNNLWIRKWGSGEKTMELKIRVGSLGGRYTVYRDPYAPANSVIVGHKGKSLLDTGYIYAPYVPLQLTPTLQNPFNYAPTKGIMTRYAKKMVNNRFYGTVTIDGVVTFDVNLLR